MDTRSLWKWNLSLHLPGYSIGCSLHRHRQATYVSVREIEPTAPSWLRLQKSHPFSEGTVPLRDIISKGNTRCPVQRCTQFPKKKRMNKAMTTLYQLCLQYSSFSTITRHSFLPFSRAQSMLSATLYKPPGSTGVVNVDQIYRSSLEGAFPKRSFP